ncbi:myosin-G heavy chain-like [Diprion similis]|uniref:myosin-G heavy chain-like n=1 Tax=Diprion similis TaxID=362088 RepID=UPI001EF76724|nr:myosin-G heavy chain-like [Diprion similis]
MPNCCIKTCKNWSGNTKNKHISFHVFPKKNELRKKWIDTCGCEKINIANARVCSIHFEESCFDIRSEFLHENYALSTRRRLRGDAFPTKFLSESTEINKRRTADVQNVSSVWKDSAKKRRVSLEFVTINKENYASTSTSHASSTANNNKNNNNNNNNKNNSTLEETCSSPSTSTRSTNFLESDETHEISAEPTYVTSEYAQHASQKGIRSVGVRTSGCKNSKCKHLKSYQSCIEENIKLQEEIRKLNRQLCNQSKGIEEQVREKIYQLLDPIFTPGQIKRLLRPNQTKVMWSLEDIASAIEFRSVSSKAYKYLLKKNFPLPGLSTLRKWAAKGDLNEEVLNVHEEIST